MTFSQRLNATRKAQGKTAQDMADMLGIGLRAYQYYEGGQREPQLAYLVMLADALGVTTDYLLGREDLPAAPVEER